MHDSGLDGTRVRLGRVSIEEWGEVVAGLGSELGAAAAGGPAQAVGLTAFHVGTFLATFAALRGWRLELLAGTASGRRVAAVPLLLARRGLLWGAAPTPFPFLGPGAADHHLADVVATLSGRVGRRGSLSLRVDRRDPTPRAVASLSDAGVAMESPRTWVVDVSGPDAPAAGYNRNTRRSLRAAAAADVEVGDLDVATAAGLLPRLLQESYAAHGASDPYAFLDPAGWEQLIRSHPGAVVHGARLDGRWVGALVTLVHAGTAYLWVGGCLREARDARANFALHDHALRSAKAAGHGAVDLVGEVDERVARFKAGLGAQPQEFVLGLRATALGRLVRRVRGLRGPGGVSRGAAAARR